MFIEWNKTANSQTSRLSHLFCRCTAALEGPGERWMCLSSLPGSITHAQWGGGVYSPLFLPGDLLRFWKPVKCVYPGQRTGGCLSSFFTFPGKADATKLGEQCSFGDVFLAYKGQRSRYKGTVSGLYFPTSVTNWARFPNFSIGFRVSNC